jgi:hypothetical protein
MTIDSRREPRALAPETDESDPTRAASVQPHREDSAEFSDTEHPLGAYDEEVSARRLRSTLARQLGHLSIGQQAEAMPATRHPSEIGPRAIRTAPPRLNSDSVEAQLDDTGDVFASAAMAIGKKRGAQDPSEAESDAPMSPGKKLRKFFTRRVARQGDDILGTSAPW